MNDLWWNWAGGILGSAIGVAGGLVGTYFSIRGTNGPRERAFMVRAALWCWLLVIAFCAGMVFIPAWYNQLLWVPYFVVLPLGLRRCNRKLIRIRQEESKG